MLCQIQNLPIAISNYNDIVELTANGIESDILLRVSDTSGPVDTPSLPKRNLLTLQKVLIIVLQQRVQTPLVVYTLFGLYAEGAALLRLREHDDLIFSDLCQRGLVLRDYLQAFVLGGVPF